MAPIQTRRRFIAGVAAAGAASLGVTPHPRAAERALETTAILLVNDGSICIAPEYVADELLRAEGFTDIHYVKAPGDRQVDALARGGLDFCAFFPGDSIPAIEAGARLSCLPASISAASNFSPGRIYAALPN